MSAKMQFDANESASPSHLFIELTSLAELSFPATTSTRIKYTCVAASSRILAVGSSSGTVYLFSRYARKNRKSLSNLPVQIVTCQDGAINLVEISPDETCLAVATNRGHVNVLNISQNHPITVLNSVLHVGAEVTCFRFSNDGSKLYAGDASGRISRHKLFNKLSFKSPSEFIFRVDSKIVQLDCFQSKLLVSTLIRCYLCDVNTSAIETTDSTQEYSPLIFCARPGGRLWEVDGKGNVYSTHQFSGLKHVWSVVGLRNTDNITSNGASISFSYLRVIAKQFILSATNDSLVLIDPQCAKVILIAEIREAISQFCVCNNDVFILTSDSTLRKLSLFTVEKAVEKLRFREQFKAAAQVVCAVHELDSGCTFRLDTISDIRAHLDSNQNNALIERLNILAEDLSTRRYLNDNVKTQQVTRLASGIHKVVRGMENSGYDDDFTFRMPRNRSPGPELSPGGLLSRRSNSSPSVNHTKHCLQEKLHDKSPIGNRQSAGQSTTMCVSRSEESLCDLLRVEVVVSDNAKLAENNTADQSHQNGGKIRNYVTDNEGDNLDPLAISPALKATLKTGGKLLLEAVQKMSLLTMGPDFGDPSSLFYDDENGFAESDDDGDMTPIATMNPSFSNQLAVNDTDTLDLNMYPELPNVRRVRRPKVKQSISKRQQIAQREESRAAPKTDNASPDRVKQKQTELTDDSEPSTRFRRRKMRCPNCGLHKSWHYAFTVGAFVRRLDLNADYFEKGGIPVDIAQWRVLLMEWRQRNVSSAAIARDYLCVDCRRLCSSWFDKNDTERNIDLCWTISGDQISSILKNEPASKLSLVFGKAAGTPVRDQAEDWRPVASFPAELTNYTNGESEMSVSMYYNPLYESVYDSEQDEDKWRWLTNVSLDVLLAISSKLLNDLELEDLLSSMPWCGEHMSGEFLRYYADDRLEVALNSRVSNLIALDMLELNNGATENNATRNAIRLDARGHCPYCTLPITSVISKEEKRLVLFPCGHCYHDKCLPPKTHSVPYCLVCDVQTRD